MSIVKKVHMCIMMAPESSFEDTVKFYKEIGLTSKFHIENKWAEFDIGGLLIGICPTSKELPDRSTGLVMQVDDLQSVYENQKDLITFLAEPVEAIHGIMVSVKDPSGNIFDLYQPTPEKVKDLVQKAKEEECCATPCQKEQSCKDDDCCC